ncbi:MAG: LysM peptidoglycan-binding domain-containing protein, partial [Actinomycetota bacterium]|nr:LysM peptidoglycan-binding domain-containing protein [Actinomycetota bacterium]
LGPLTAPPRAGVTVEELVTVRRGETLWAIAARHLGPSATTAEIADAWPRWYAANRAVVGDDPDHIEPGQQLVPPAIGASG